MARPLMKDVVKHRRRRIEEANAGLEALGNLCLGAPTAGPRLVVRTLPFVHLMLTFSRGQHPTLRHLPHSLMRLVQELTAPIGSGVVRPSDVEVLPHDPGAGRTPPALAENGPTFLEEDPIESF